MRLGFVGGAVFATWLTLTYPAEMSAVFNKLTTIFQGITSPAAEIVPPEKQ